MTTQTQSSFRGHAALRRGRQSQPSQLYLLTTATNNRVPRFEICEHARAVARAIDDSALWRDSQLLCWVLMPDHWHGLLELGASESLGSLMRRFKAVTSATLRQLSGDRGAIWSRGYHDRALRFERQAIAVARYVVGNPVRAGLVEKIGDYPYWNARWVAEYDVRENREISER